MVLGFELPNYRDQTVALLSGAQETLHKAILVLLTVTTLLWMSIFLYASFYYYYMPPVSHTRPVHLQFSRSCGKEVREMCNFPSSNVTLTKRENFLMVGQPYKIVLELEMPESPENKNLGMFMVCAKLKSRDIDIVASSCRSAMLQYKSFILHIITTFMHSVFLVSGSMEEKQLVTVELFSNFQEDKFNPVIEAFIQIESHRIEVYKTSLKIHAHFTGLRYFMFYWPVTAACMGVSTNLFFLTVIAFLSWYKFFTPSQTIVHVGYDAERSQTLAERRVQAKQRLMRERGISAIRSSVSEEVELMPSTPKDEPEEDLEQKDDQEEQKVVVHDEDEEQVVPLKDHGGNDSESDYEDKVDDDHSSASKASDGFEVIPEEHEERKESQEQVQETSKEDQGQTD